MKFKIEDLPRDLQPIARLVNRLDAMNTLVRKKAETTSLVQAHESIAQDLVPLASKYPALQRTLDSLSATLGKPIQVNWMSHANDLRELLLVGIKTWEAAGLWKAEEVDLRHHQGDEKPAG